MRWWCVQWGECGSDVAAAWRNWPRRSALQLLSHSQQQQQQQHGGNNDCTNTHNAHTLLTPAALAPLPHSLRPLCRLTCARSLTCLTCALFASWQIVLVAVVMALAAAFFVLTSGGKGKKGAASSTSAVGQSSHAASDADAAQFACSVNTELPANQGTNMRCPRW